MLPSLLRRRQRLEDPFAPDRENWVNNVMTKAIFVIFFIFGIGGSLMFIGGSLYFMWGGRIKHSTRWAWPVWGGLCMIAAVIPLVLLVALCLTPFKGSAQRRIEARRQRRMELLDSNKPPTGLPAVITPMLPVVPPPAAISTSNLRHLNGDVEANVAYAAFLVQKPIEEVLVRAPKR
ncbi:hypothetical protein DL93DRAFT_2161249 [Clavulina sp. PMI_390]|nr:hypothetical protein DL93DRAFT_2161249 [Clavulina sp. PMI_390]